MTHSQTSKKQNLAQDTFSKLMRCTSSVTGDVHKHIQNQLTVSQYGILESLALLGPISQKELAGRILKSPGNITTIINNLEKAGLVVRVLSSQDKRYYAIHLTDKGRRLIDRILPAHAEILSRRMAVLTDEEQQALGRLLQKLSMSSDVQDQD